MMSWFPTGPSSSPLLPGKKVGASKPRASFTIHHPLSTLIQLSHPNSPTPPKWSSSPRSKMRLSPISPCPARTMPCWSPMTRRITPTPVSTRHFPPPDSHASRIARSSRLYTVVESHRWKRVRLDSIHNRHIIRSPGREPINPRESRMKTPINSSEQYLTSPLYYQQTRKSRMLQMMSSRRRPSPTVSRP